MVSSALEFVFKSLGLGLETKSLGLGLGLETQSLGLGLARPRLDCQ